MAMTCPNVILRGGHRTWLKWHRARRRASDPVFTGARIIEAMRTGASVEVDLVVHGGGGFAVLHNLSLEEETTGRGPVRAADAATLRGLQLRDNAGNVLADRVMLLEDLCALLREEPPHPEALLQLDFKEDIAAVDARVLAGFGGTIGGLGPSMILSGGDLAAVTALTAAAPGLRMGYDPCHGDSIDELRRSGDFAGWIGEALAVAPGAELIYLAHEIVTAADDAGVDLIALVHAAGRRVDAYTIQRVTSASLDLARRLIGLKVDQITTDDPEGLCAGLTDAA
jgi:glycerophosphoryl diester phosphodiesterase